MGQVTVCGIYFDTGKSEMKPESEPALREIAALLQKASSLELHVVGHRWALELADYFPEIF